MRMCMCPMSTRCDENEGFTKMNHLFKSFATDPFTSFKNPVLDMLSLSVSQMVGETDVMLSSFHSFLIMKESSWCFNRRKKITAVLLEMKP